MRSLVGLVFLTGTMLAGCEQGPAQKAGSKIDRSLDRLSGKGPVEKAGERSTRRSRS